MGGPDTPAPDALRDAALAAVLALRSEPPPPPAGTPLTDWPAAASVASFANVLRTCLQPDCPPAALAAFAESSQSAEARESLLTAGILAMLNRPLPALPPALSASSEKMVLEALHLAAELICKLLPKNNERVAEAFAMLFNTGTRFFTSRGLERPPPEDEVTDSVKLAELNAWRRSLTRGVWVDVLRNDTWRAARIMDINETHYRVNFENLSPMHDDLVLRDSTRILPFRSKSKERELEQWRKDLAVGKQCDLVDSMHKWYTATILDYKEATDEFFFNYDGWSHKFDEWVPRGSDRLASFKSIALGGKEEGGVMIDPLDRLLDDSDDPVDKPAVFRGRDWGSFHVVGLMNVVFGQFHVLDVIIEKIPSSNLSLIKLYIDTLGKLSNLFSKHFASEHFPKLSASFFDAILKLSDLEMRALSKELLEQLQEHIDKLLRRAMSRHLVGVELERFSMEIALKRFHSSVIERRINGLTFIANKVMKIRQLYSLLGGSSSGDRGFWISSTKILLDWLAEKRVLEDIFEDPRTWHVELLKRSVEIVKFLCSEKQFTPKQLSMIWSVLDKCLLSSSVLNTDEQAFVASTYKLLEEASYFFETDVIEALVDKIEKIPIDKFSVATVDLIKSITRFSTKTGPGPIVKALDILWELIQDNHIATGSSGALSSMDEKKGVSTSSEVADAARSKFEEILRTASLKAERILYIQKILENLKSSRSVPQSLAILPSIVETYPLRKYEADDTTKNEIIEFLDKDGNILGLLFEDLKKFQAKARKTISSLGITINSEINSYIIGSRTTFLDHSKCRLDFLKVLLANSKLNLTTDHLDIIWTEFYENALTLQQKELVMRWLTDAVKSKRSSAVDYIAASVGSNNGDSKEFSVLEARREDKLFSEELMIYVFEKKLCKVATEDLSLAGYRCLEAYFLFVNQQRGKLKIQLVDESSIVNVPFTVLDFSSLYGLEVLWRVVWDTKASDVASTALQFLHNCHERLTFEQKKDKELLKKIRQNFVFTCMNRFAKCVADKNFDGISRVITLLNLSLDSTERATKLVEYMFGSGKETKIRAHGQQLKGKTATIEVFSNVSSPDVPKKLSLNVYETDTFGDLRAMIGRDLKMHPRYVRMLIEGQELSSEAYDSKPLCGGAYPKEFPKTITVLRSENTSRRVELLDPVTKKLTSKAKEAFTEIFNRYCDPELHVITKPDLYKFIMSCGVNVYNASDERLHDLFKQYGYVPGYSKDLEMRRLQRGKSDDFSTSPPANLTANYGWDDSAIPSSTSSRPVAPTVSVPPEEPVEPTSISAEKKDESAEPPKLDFPHMTLDHFLGWYTEASDMRSYIVWRDLTAQGYVEDLNKEIDLINEEKLVAENFESDTRLMLSGFVSISKEDSSKMSSGSGFFDLLFEALKLEESQKSKEATEVSERVWSLLMRIPTNQKLKDSLTTLESVGTGEDKSKWDLLLDSKSVRKLLYSLQVIESLLTPSTTHSGEASASEVEELERDNWRRKFLEAGGFSHMYRILVDFHVHEGSSKKASRMCLSLLLQMISSFVVGSLSIHRPVAEDAAKFLEESNEEILKFSGEAPAQQAVAGQHSPYSPTEIVGMDEYGNAIPAPPPLPGEVASPMIAAPPPSYTPPEKKEDSVKISSEDKEAEMKGELAATTSDAKTESKDESSSKDFKRLVRQMSTGFGEQILRSVVFEELQQKLFQLIFELISGDQVSFNLESFDLASLQECSKIIICLQVFMSGGDLLEDLYRLFKGSKHLLLEPLLHTDATIRKTIARIIWVLSSKLRVEFSDPSLEKPSIFFSKLLLNSLPDKASSSDHNYETYFIILTMVVKQRLSTQKEKDEVKDEGLEDLKDLNEKITKQILDHRSSESLKLSENKVDRILVGLLKLLTVLVEYDRDRPLTKDLSPLDFMKKLLKELLFSTGLEEDSIANNWPKCKTEASRRAGFGLIVQYVSGSGPTKEILRVELLKILTDLQAKVSRTSSWSAVPGSRAKSPVGYVGLKNQGCTCYMNSLIQQFYMMPDFRKGVLSSEISFDSIKTKEDHLLYQLQTLFGFLGVSERMDYDTLPFCFSYKDETGKTPVDVRVQQDAQEFLAVFSDRIERLMKKTPYEKLLHEVFVGKLANQMICQGGCGKIREQEEDFYTISLEVVSKPTLAESLEAYVASEQLSDVHCDSCGKKCVTNRRVVLKDLPNTVIFHLKRFHLNYETFMNEKRNDRFVFPMKVNLEPYTKEGMSKRDLVAAETKKKESEESSAKAADSAPKADDGKASSPEGKAAEPEDALKSEAPVDEKKMTESVPVEFMEGEYWYQLTGVIIHMGTAQAGHYYSYIKERGSDRWFEFNDSLVTPFDPSKLDEEAFGGKSEGSSGARQSWEIEFYRNQDKIKNAYMLVYERIKKKPTSLEEKELAPEKLVPAHIFESVKEDNIRFLRDRQVYDPSYSAFILDFLQKFNFTPCPSYRVPADAPSDVRQSTELLIFGATFVLEIVAKPSNSSILKAFVEFLKTEFEKNIAASKYFLQGLLTSPSTLLELILTAGDVTSRNSFSDFIASLILSLIPHEFSFFGEEEEITIPAVGSTPAKVVKRKRAISEGILDTITANFESAVKNWSRLESFFGLYLKVLTGSIAVRNWMVTNDFVARFGDFFLGEYSPYHKAGKPVIQLASRVSVPRYDNLLRCISVLVCSSAVAPFPVGIKPPPTLQQPLDSAPSLSKPSLDVICHRMFIPRCLEFGQALTEVFQLLQHLAYEWPEYSDMIITLILDGIQRATDENVRPYFELMQRFVAVEDSLQDARIASLFDDRKGILHLIDVYKNAHKKFTYESIRALFDVAEAVPKISEKLAAERSKWVWMDRWCKDYVTQGYGAVPPPASQQEARLKVFSKIEAELKKHGLEVNLEAPTFGRIDEVSSSVGGLDYPARRDAAYMPIPSTPSSGALVVYGPAPNPESNLAGIGEPAVPPGDSGGSSEWACSTCTFLNPMSSFICQICEATRN